VGVLDTADHGQDQDSSQRKAGLAGGSSPGIDNPIQDGVAVC
jgi:hypothetical protein